MLLHLRLLTSRLIWNDLTIWSYLLVRKLALILRDYISSMVPVILVISEQIVLLRINYCFNNFSCSVSLLRKNLHNNVHDLWDHSWESLENFISYLMSNLLQLLVGVLDEFKCWISEFLKLRINQVYEYVYRGESWQTVSFMHSYSCLNVAIIVFLSGLVTLEFLVKFIEIQLDLSSS